jgi:UDP-N-acetyl-D-glucosamine/UDP-N-acetyl-D-galactosamine dehydrogenase
MPSLDTTRLGIIGLGYVGLPLAVEFNKKKSTVGFDLKPDRIAELWRHVDVTREVCFVFRFAYAQHG